MPNHITTKIQAKAEVLNAMVRIHTEEERIIHEHEEDQRYARYVKRGIGEEFTREEWDPDHKFVDFNLMIPQPENIERADCPGGADPNGLHSDGTVCWWTFRVNQWGTKWNGYNTSLTEGPGISELSFDSAWSHPYPVIEALSKKFPDETLEVWYADEDLGHNFDHYRIKNGNREETLGLVEGSPGALHFASWLKYGKTYLDVLKEWEEYGDIDDESYPKGEIVKESIEDHWGLRLPGNPEITCTCGTLHSGIESFSSHVRELSNVG